MKLAASLFTGGIIVAVEYLIFSIIGEAVESSILQKKNGGLTEKNLRDENANDKSANDGNADFGDENANVGDGTADSGVAGEEQILPKENSIGSGENNIEKNPFENIFDEQDNEKFSELLIGETNETFVPKNADDENSGENDDAVEDTKSGRTAENTESSSGENAEENPGENTENFLFEDFSYKVEPNSDEFLKSQSSCLNDDSDFTEENIVSDEQVKSDGVFLEDETEEKSDVEDGENANISDKSDEVCDENINNTNDEINDENDYEKGVSENPETLDDFSDLDFYNDEVAKGEDGFGDDVEIENSDGNDDLLNFVEKRNSSFQSIFEQMRSDAEKNPVLSKTAGQSNSFGDENGDKNTGISDRETLAESSTSKNKNSALENLEFDPTAAPVVDCNGLPYGTAVPLDIKDNSFEEIAMTKKDSTPLSFAQKAVAVEKKSLPKRNLINYKIPIEGILQTYDNGEYWIIDEATRKKALDLKQTLAEFNIEVEVTGIRKGPVVTMFEVLPAPGVNVNKIRSLQDNIALRLAAISVRIVSPIPGKSAVGIEIPNKTRAIVSFREILENKNTLFDKMAIPVILGKDISGEPQVIDLAKTPHLLIAGSTGSGKSVCVNSLILSILYKRNPAQVKLILIDPKVVELKLYNDIPHLLTPVITEPKKALQALQYCICEMERRYALLDNMGVRDITSYNRRISERKLMQEKLPYIVIIIDEFADLMATTGKELESNVARLAAMSRAVGIHLVLATQRPSVNVITGLIKANIPSRIAFMVASRTDSNIIIDQIGAEKLLGKGDMLYASATDPFPVRIQGTLVSDDEVEKVVECVKQYGEPDYIDDEIFVEDEDDSDQNLALFSDGEDSLYDQALEIVMQSGKASASYLQRRLKIGYNRAARLVEEMEDRGIVGPQNGSKPREVIYVP
ncbi:DNA translocase FtsK [Treponema pectinovorum]